MKLYSHFIVQGHKEIISTSYLYFFHNCTYSILRPILSLILCKQVKDQKKSPMKYKDRNSQSSPSQYIQHQLLHIITQAKTKCCVVYSATPLHTLSSLWPPLSSKSSSASTCAMYTSKKRSYVMNQPFRYSVSPICGIFLT